jgi:hypothetical protein
MSSDKQIRLSGHATDQIRFRGATESEVREAIRSAPWKTARSPRLECSQEFPFEALWNGQHYARKRVRPIFVERPEEIVVITVYVYYF